MYNFTIAFNNKKKLYLQLYEYIVSEIRSGHLLPDERMPSKKALSQHLHISVNTVETAYSILVQEGFLVSIPRSGYYVSKSYIPKSSALNYQIPEPSNNLKYQYDFSTSAIDPEAFPAHTWIKLSKEVMYESPELLRAGEFSGDIELRCAIAKYLYEFRGVNCSPAQIVIGAGMEYLLMLLHTILPLNSIYAMENPGYGKINNILSNSKIEYINLDKYGMIFSELAYSGANIAYITPSHQFPTGTIMNVDRRCELLKWAYSAKNRYIIEDDYNSEFTYSIKPIPALQGMDTKERVIYMSTFSRTLAPSIRIAYMVLPKTLLTAFKSRFDTFSPTVPRFEQHTLERFISGGYLERHLNRTRLIYRKRRDALINMLNSLNIPIKISGEKSGMQLIINTEYANDILQNADKYKIKLSNLDSYYFTEQEQPSNSIIIGYALATEQNLTILEKMIRDVIK